MPLTEKEELELLELENENALASKSTASDNGPDEISGKEALNVITGFPKSAELSDERRKELGGNFGTTYKALSVPSRELTRGLKAIVAKIPDPETRSAAVNFALGIPETLGDIGAELGGGAISPESILLMGLPEGAISGPLKSASQKLKAVAKERFPAISQALTGVQKKYFARVFDKPRLASPFGGGTKSLEEAGEAVGRAERRSFGDAAEATINEINDPAATTARANAIRAAEKVKQARELAKTDPNAAREILSRPETGAMILKGKRGTQFQLDQPSTKGQRAHLLSDQREEFAKVLEDNFPEMGPALRDYAESVTNEQVTKLLPVLKSGDPSVMRLFLTAIGRTVGAPVGLSVPAANSAAIALTRLSLDQLEKVASSVPRLKALAVAEIARRKGQENAE